MKEVWENPEIQSICRLPMRSPLIPYSSTESAQNDAASGPESVGQAVNSPYYALLDGKWQFCLMDAPNADYSGVNHGWQTTDFDASGKAGWGEITVPGTWTLQDKGDYPHYTNVQMPFPELPPDVPKRNPTGLYRLDAKINSAWRGRRIVLHIGSAESCTIVFVNGMKVGVSKDTRLPAEFDITQCIRWSDDGALPGDDAAQACYSGRALFAIKVVRYSDASFIEDQDQWWFGGIHRSVYLYSTEDRYIADVEALTSIKNGGEISGVLPLNVRLGHSGVLVKDKAVQMSVTVKYAINVLGGTASHGELKECVASGEAASNYDYSYNLNTVHFDINVPNVRMWSHETPNLYVVCVSLCETSGRVMECVAFTVGFKSVTIKNRELLINGKKVYICGVNRHEHNEYHGKTLTTEEMARDVRILKSHNFNAVRTCHYPDDEVWYELCDRYGLLVMDEANVECHAFYDCLSRSDTWTASFMMRAQRMVRRDKNHACIFCWSLGNESGNGPNLAAGSMWIKRTDPTRIVNYEGFIRPEFRQGGFTLESLALNKDVCDIISPMYPSIDLITEYAETREDWRPLIMCEYSHAMGNANGSLADYWKAIESHHGLQGGFIWDYIDQGIAATAPNGQKYWKYGGDFGDKPSDYDFCINGLMFSDQTPKPAMEECRYLFAAVRVHDVHAAQGVLRVENRRLFTNVDDVALKWELLACGKAVAAGNVQLPEIAPQSCADVTLRPESGGWEYFEDSKQGWQGSAEVVLHTELVYARDMPFAKAGALIRADEFVLQAAQGYCCFEGTADNQQPTAGSIGVSRLAEDTVHAFTPVLFRAITENEGVKAELPRLNEEDRYISFNGKPTKQWINSGLLNMKVEQTADGEYALLSPDNAREHKVFGTYNEKITVAASPDGSSALLLTGVFHLNSSAEGGLDEYPRVGLMAAVPSSLCEVTWYGRGWHECYSDRKASAMLGLYHAAASDLEVPYMVPQENGARCDTRYVSLSGTNDGGKVLHIQSLNPFSFGISRYTLSDLFASMHTAELTDLTRGDGSTALTSPRRILTIDAAHRGVGTGACGPDTLEAYRVRPGVYTLRLLVW